MASDVHIVMHRHISIFSLIFLSVVICQESLYTAKDLIEVLDINNFNSTVYEDDRVRFIEFYSSWCGHCIRFAPTWKQLAQAVKEWSSVVKVSAINCAEHENLPVCRRHDVKGYPTIKIYPAMASPSYLGKEYVQEKTVDIMTNEILDYVERISASNRPPSWPKLHLLPSLEKIWQDVEQHASKVEKTVILLEGNDTRLGRQLILEMSSFHPRLLIRRMGREEAAKFVVKDFPSLYLIDKDGTFKLIASKKNLTDMVKELKDLMGVNTVGSHGENGNEIGENNSTGNHLLRRGIPGLHVEDLESGLHYSLRQEVAGFSIIDEDHLDALKNYIAVLAKYYPGHLTTFRFLGKIDSWLRQHQGPLTGEAWLNTINSMQSNLTFLRPSVEWRGCSGSSTKFRGYPCSLWSLFHALTVSAGLRQDQEQAQDFDATEVLLAMKGYIENFFGCRECSKNFGKMAVTIQQDVTSSDNAILWLWRAHNKANKRLHGDASEDPQHPKVQFPGVQVCELCWTKIANNRTFDEVAVLKFLKEFYSLELSKDDQRRSDLENFAKVRASKKDQIKDDKAHEGSKVTVDLEKIERWRELEKMTRLGSRSGMGWGFTSVDMSMCVVFYVMCTVIIFLLYLHLSINKRMSICCCCRRKVSRLPV